MFLLVWSLCAIAVGSEALPQCNPQANGTTFNGTQGSEQQLNSTTVRKIDAQDAIQGVATTGNALLQWYGGENGPIIHLDGGVVIDGVLYAPHSNYPQSPIWSSVEMWNATTMEHLGSHPFGIDRGSLTWIDRDANGIWYGTFANYDRVQPGQMLPYGLTMRTQFVQFNDNESWSVNRSWIFPEALYQSFSPMSNSGGSFGPDGWLYVTGHDASAVYVVKVPSAGSILIWVATIQAPDIAGQGIAWDRSQGRTGNLYGISREASQVVEMRIPLQNCSWHVPTAVGAVYGPAGFIDVSDD